MTTSFKEWMNQRQEPDFHEVEQVYGKAHIAVQIVQMYDPDLLKNISTIANLSSGAYGLYNSGEVQKELPPDIQQKLIFTGKVDKNNISKIPNIVLKRYFPELDENKIKEADTIRVNVRRILSQVKSQMEAIIQIASTIVHEATHAREMQIKGYTNEGGPEAAEKDFQKWVSGNIKQVMRKFPELNLPQQNLNPSNSMGLKPQVNTQQPQPSFKSQSPSSANSMEMGF